MAQDYEKTLSDIKKYVTGYQPKYFNTAVQGYKVVEWSLEDKVGFINWLFDKDFSIWPDYLLYYETIGAVLRNKPKPALAKEDIVRFCGVYENHLEFFDASSVIEFVNIAMPKKHDEDIDNALKNLLKAIENKEHVFPQRAKKKDKLVEKMKSYLTDK